tara:strand:- start:532 stop:1032 length:501 start_codon:yes stop_codon:yes gene_type:complete
MNKRYDIAFVGLKQGSHHFRFEIGKSFFEEFPYSLVEEGDLIADLVLDKKETIMIANFSVKGHVRLSCSRCNDPAKIQVKDTVINYYKFGTEIEEDDNLFVLSPDEYKINVAQQLYELIIISLPASPTHEKGDCNEEMMELIKKYQRKNTKNEKIDPRWEKLNKLN